MIRLILTVLATLIVSPAVGQITFSGFEVTDFEIVKGEKFNHYKDDIQVRTEDVGKFDAILVYTEERKFVFADQHGEDTTFKNTYAELVDRYGREDRNRDSIPPSYKDSDLQTLRALIRNNQARIHRLWRLPEEKLNHILLIWDKGGLTLVFDS